MIHRRLRPGGEAVGVAGVALTGDRDVARRLGQRVLGNIGAGVTGRALSRRAGMAHLGRFEGDIVVVTGIARRRGRDVAGRLAQRVGPVVAGRAASGHNVLMRVAGRFPGRSRMAGVAPGRRLDMGQRLAQRVGEIVAAAVASGALPGRPGVAHLGRPEGCEIGVTAIALRTGRNVIDRFAERRAAVVAGRTIAGGAGLVGILHQCPAIGRGMTGVALRRGADVGDRFGQGVAIDVSAAVAGRTLPLHPGVVHHRWRPRGIAIDVTGIALGRGRNMNGRLGQRIGEQIGAVMASRAFAGACRMVHAGRGESGKRRVAAVALGTGRHVIGRLAEGIGAVVAA